MKKYLPLLISTIITTAFVVVKKSVIPALPGINKIINGGCTGELDSYTKKPLKPNDQQAKENNQGRDSLTSFLVIREYTFQNHPQQKQAQNNQFSIRLYGRIGRQDDGTPASRK